MQDSGFNLTCWDNCENRCFVLFVSCPSCAGAQRQAEVQVAQVPVPAGWQGHAEDFCFPCQCLHAAVRPKRQEARVLVRCSFWEVSAIPSLAELHFKCQLPVLLKWNCLLIHCSRPRCSMFFTLRCAVEWFFTLLVILAKIIDYAKG